jgi:hypothetical protein
MDIPRVEIPADATRILLANQQALFRTHSHGIGQNRMRFIKPQAVIYDAAPILLSLTHIYNSSSGGISGLNTKT